MPSSRASAPERAISCVEGASFRCERGGRAPVPLPTRGGTPGRRAPPPALRCRRRASARRRSRRRRGADRYHACPLPSGKGVESRRFSCRRARASIGLERRLADAHDLGRLALRSILEVEEQDGGALPRRQRFDGIAERKRRFVRDEACVGGARPRSGKSSSALSSTKLRRRRSSVDRAIVADAVEPRADPRVGRPRRGVLPKPDQRVLHDVLGLLEIAEQCRARSAAGCGASRSISRWKAAESPAAMARISPSSAAAASSCLAKGHLALNAGRDSMPPAPLNRE